MALPAPSVRLNAGSVMTGSDQGTDGFQWVRDRCRWLPPSSAIPPAVAKGLVREAVFWWAHPSGRVVPAPRFADHVEVRGPRNLHLRFGVNSMNIGSAIHEARLILLSSYKRVWRGASDSVAYAQPLVRDAVLASFETTIGIPSTRSFRVEHGRVILGAHLVDADLAARFLVRASGLEQFQRIVVANGLPPRDNLVDAFIATPSYVTPLPKRLRSARKRRPRGPRDIPGRVVWVEGKVAEIQHLFPGIGKSHRVWRRVAGLLDTAYWYWRRHPESRHLGESYAAVKAKVWRLLQEVEQRARS